MGVALGASLTTAKAEVPMPMAAPTAAPSTAPMHTVRGQPIRLTLVFSERPIFEKLIVFIYPKSAFIRRAAQVYPCHAHTGNPPHNAVTMISGSRDRYIFG